MKLSIISIFTLSALLMSCNNSNNNYIGSWECSNCADKNHLKDAIILEESAGKLMMTHFEPDFTSSFFGGISGKKDIAYKIVSGVVDANGDTLSLNVDPKELFSFNAKQNTLSYSNGKQELIYSKLQKCSVPVSSPAAYIANPQLIIADIGKCSQTQDPCVKQTCFNINVADLQIQIRTSTIQSDIKSIKAALQLYKIDNGQYPTEQQGLSALVKKPVIAPIPANYRSGAYLQRLPSDPWGNAYTYSINAAKVTISISTSGLIPSN